MDMNRRNLPRKGKPIVVVIGDDPSVQRVLGRLLRLHRFVSLHASSTGELLGVVEHHEVDAFVVDLNLKGTESGLDVLAWLRLQPQYVHTPVLLITGLTEVSAGDEELIRQHRASVLYKVQTLMPVVEYLERLLLGGRGGSSTTTTAKTK